MWSHLAEKSANTRATVTLEAPPGDLGLCFVSSPHGPTVDAIAPDSPLQLEVGIGWLLLRVDDVSTSKLDHHSTTTVLRDKRDSKRMCTFLDPVLADAVLSGGTPAERCVGGRVEVQAPPGRLGIELHLARGGPGGELCPTVRSLRPASPLAHTVGVGWRLLTIDGADCTTKGHGECAAMLTAAAGRPRALLFDAPAKRSRAVAVAQDLLWCGYVVAVVALLLGIIHLLWPALLDDLLLEYREALNRTKLGRVSASVGSHRR